MDMFEQVDEVPGVFKPHYEYASKVIREFSKAGIKYARLTNIPKFNVGFMTLLDTLRQVATAKHVRVMRRGTDIYLFNEQLGGD